MPRKKKSMKKAGPAVETVSVAGKDLVIMEVSEYEHLLDQIDAAEARRISRDEKDPVLSWDEIKDDFLQNRIADVRKRAGLSQMELASRLGVKQSTLSRWERPNANLTLETLRKIAAALKCDVHQLLS